MKDDANKQIIVVIRGGKREDIDWMKVVLAPNMESASNIVSENQDLYNKYWKSAMIVNEDEIVECYRPQP